MKFLSKAWKWIKNIFSGAKKGAEVAVKVVDLFKKAVESDVVTTIVNIIPGNIDNEAVQKLREILPAVAKELAEAKALIDANGSPQEVIAQYVVYLQRLAPDLRAADYQTLAGKITMAFADGKITLLEGIDMSQEMYVVLKKKGIVS